MNQVFDQNNEDKAIYLDIESEIKEGSYWLQQFPQLIYIVRVGTWILLLTNFVPISLLVTTEMVKFIQARFMEWDVDLISESKGLGANV